MTYLITCVLLAQFSHNDMSLSSRENKGGSPEKKYGSGTMIVSPAYTGADVHRSLAMMFSDSSPSKDDDTNVVQSRANGECLSDADRQALFTGLQATLQRPETCEGARALWGAIEQALLRNPRIIRNLKKLQDMGAELVVMEFQEGQYVEFADAAQNLDIRKQEAGLAELTDQERNDAIETIVAPLGDDTQKALARAWLFSQLRRSDNVMRGLNFAEALVFAVAHGGTLISHAVYDAMAQRDTSAYENNTWTWYITSLSDVISNGDAPLGNRYRGKANRREGVAVYRRGGRGVRVAGLRVEIA